VAVSCLAAATIAALVRSFWLARPGPVAVVTAPS
jgi:hypothetical protein